MRAILMATLILIIFKPAQAQSDTQPIAGHFGFIVGMDYTHLKVSTILWEHYKIDDEINSLDSEGKLGFSLGLAYFIELSNNFTLRPQTIFSFQSNRLTYNFALLEKHKEKIQPVTIEIPAHFIYTNRKDKYFMPSFLMGLKYIRDISLNNGDHKLTLKKNDFAFDIGGGLDVRIKKLNMRPELILSLGMSGLNVYKNDIYHKAISGLARDKISFRVSFYRT